MKTTPDSNPDPVCGCCWYPELIRFRRNSYGCLLLLPVQAHADQEVAERRKSAAASPWKFDCTRIKALFTSLRNLKTFQDFSLHQILLHMYKTLNMDENKN